MNADIYAEWLRRQGHHVVHTSSSYWYEIGPRIYQAIPAHWLISPPQQELHHLLAENKAIGLRYSTALDSSSGVVSYHIVYEEPEYKLSDLSQKTRYAVRKGLKNVSIEPVSFSRLASEGWSLTVETMVRQGRVGAESQHSWESMCRSADGLPGFEAWAAIADGKLVASLLAFTCDDWYVFLYQQSLTEYLKQRVNNALVYVSTSEALQRPGITRLFYGLQSLDAPASVDGFKFHMNYTAKPVRQRLVFHPWLAPVFNQTCHAAVRLLKRWWPSNRTLSKAEGMLRLYLEGKRPLNEQNWPACLADYKSGMLKAQGA
jgi:hypothetical protein